METEAGDIDLAKLAIVSVFCLRGGYAKGRSRFVTPQPLAEYALLRAIVRLWPPGADLDRELVFASHRAIFDEAVAGVASDYQYLFRDEPEPHDGTK